MDLSIVIINWNGQAVLRNCLLSIYGTRPSLAFEVIVVDNASRDESVRMLHDDFPQVILISNPTNAGFAAANNQAFAVAQGRHILLLNNDTLVLPGALAASARFIDEHPDVGVLGCRIEFPDRSFQTSCYRFNNLLELFMIRLLPLGSVAHERLNIGRYRARQFSRPTDVDVVAGCFMMVRHEVISRVGGLDQDFFMYGEDEEWCSRIRQSGWRIVYFPAATIIHIHRFSSGKARHAGGLGEIMAPVLVLDKRRGYLVAWLANLILLVGAAIRMPAWLLADAVRVFQGRTSPDIIRKHILVLAAHVQGIVRPIWRPATYTRIPVHPSLAPPRSGRKHSS